MTIGLELGHLNESLFFYEFDYIHLWRFETRRRIHERTISLRFLVLIWRVLRLEVSVWISKTMGKGVWFFIRFPPFSFTEIVRGCVSLKKIEIPRQSC
jgi:hypothetical protein